MLIANQSLKVDHTQETLSAQTLTDIISWVIHNSSLEPIIQFRVFIHRLDN